MILFIVFDSLPIPNIRAFKGTSNEPFFIQAMYYIIFYSRDSSRFNSIEIIIVIMICWLSIHSYSIQIFIYDMEMFQGPIRIHIIQEFHFFINKCI